jgi:hypothetical protein
MNTRCERMFVFESKPGRYDLCRCPAKGGGPGPLSKVNLMDDEYIPIGPFLPLAGLIGDGAARQ